MRKPFITLYFLLFASLSVFSQTNNRIVLSTFYNQVNDYKGLFENTVGDDTMARHKIKKFTETVVDNTNPEKTVNRKSEYFYERNGNPVKRILTTDGKENIYTYRYDMAKNITFKSYKNLSNFDSIQYANGKVSAISVARGNPDEITETRRFIYGEEDELLEKIIDPGYTKKEKVLYAFKYTDMHMVAEYYHFEKEKTPEWEKKEDKENEDRPKGKYMVALLDKFYFNSENFLEKAEFYRNDSLQVFFEFKYNSEGKTLEYFKKKDTKPATKGENTVFVWGTNGKIAEKLLFEEGILTNKETYTYDTLDQMILYVGYEKKEVLSDSLFETERSAVFYNKFGQFTKRVLTKKYPGCSNPLAAVKTEETIITFEYKASEKKEEAGKLIRKVSEKNECGSKSTIEICYDKMGFRTTYKKTADGKVVFNGKREYEFFTEKK